MNPYHEGTQQSIQFRIPLKLWIPIVFAISVLVALFMVFVMAKI